MTREVPRQRLRVLAQKLWRSRRAARMACGLAALLLAVQVSRGVLAYTREQALAPAALPVAEGARTSPRTTEASPARPEDDRGPAAPVSTILKRLPSERQPGMLLSDLFEILDAAGVESYRYRLLLGDTLQPGGERISEDLSDQPISALLPFTADDGTEMPALVPLDLTGTELPPPPPGVRKWDLALHVRASYLQVIAALEALDADDRIWDVPRASLYNDGTGTEADLRLVAYTKEARAEATRDPAAPPDSGFTARVHAVPIEAASMLDPFGIARDGSPAGHHARSAVPCLGGIRVGAGEAAWLDGQVVRPGERVGPWTLLEVHPGEVWVRHDHGKRLRLRLDEPSTGESSDVRP